MPFRRFLHFVVQRSRTMAWLMVCAGVLSGLLSAGVLALINHVLHHPSDHSFLVMLGFVVLVAGKLLSNLWSQLLLVRFSQDTILDLSLSLCAKIVRAPLRRSEQRGAANMLVTLTDDVSWVTWAIQCFPQLIMNVAVVLGCGFYLAWLSWGTFLGVVGVTLFGALGYRWLHTSAFSVIYAAREARAELFQHFRSLTDGLKELLMHRARRQEFVNQEVRRAAELYRQANLEATRTASFVGSMDSGHVLLPHRFRSLSVSICGDTVPRGLDGVCGGRPLHDGSYLGHCRCGTNSRTRPSGIGEY